MTNQDMANLIAGGDIRPNRFVKASTAADNTGLECNSTDTPIGISTDSTIDFTSDLHANSTAGTDEISLQPGRVNEISAGGSITRAAFVVPDAEGEGVTATSGQYMALESATDGAIIRVIRVEGGAGLAAGRIQHHVADDTLTREEAGLISTNLGEDGTVTLTLPQDAIAGDIFEFVVMAAFELRIDPGAAGAIYINGAKQTDDMFISANDEGESIKLVADGNGDWASMYTTGTWTVETPA